LAGFCEHETVLLTSHKRLGVSLLSNIHYQLSEQDSSKELLLDNAATSDVFVNDSAAEIFRLFASFVPLVIS